MNVQRSPPSTTSRQTDEMPTDSDSTARSEVGKKDRSNVMPRYKKRKVFEDPDNDSLSLVKKDLMDLINSKFDELHDDIKELKDRNAEMCKNFEFMAHKYEEMKSKMELIDKEAINSKKYIMELEEKVETLERNNRSSSIEIKNIPKKQGETKLDLPELTKCIGKALDLDIQKAEIQDAYRVNVNSNGNPPIVVKFTTVFRKEEFIRKAKKLMKDNPSKLSAQIRCLGYPAAQIFVAEHLTAKIRRLFQLARDFAKTNHFQFCWCSYGRIFLRKSEGAPHLLIKEERQLEDLRNSQ